MPHVISCCTCFGNSVSLNNHCNPTSNKCGDCMSLGHILVGCENSIAPCNTADTLKIPFDCFCIPCETPTFKILDQASIQHLTVVSIDKTGITVRPTGTGNKNSKVKIKFKAVCKNGDCDVKSDYGSVTVLFKDLCKGVLCVDGKYCEECTGNCIDKVGNLNVGSLTLTGSQTISASGLTIEN